MHSINRRQALMIGGAVTSSILAATRTDAANPTASSPFRYCLNTSTVRGQDIGIVAQVDLAAEAGYDGIEPWIREVRAYEDAGGKLDDLRKRIEDAGLTVESAIGFANWIVDDDAKRLKGFDDAKRDMELVRSIGGTRIAAPPAGATQQSDLDLMKAASRYGALLKLGEEMGVVPQLELWGFSKSLSRIGELLYVASESGHEQACVMPDVYHIYKGGSDFEGLRLIDGSAMHCFHMNDYPADPPRDKISDADRVYPGDGVAPLDKILRILHDNGFRGALSLELFNREYWKQDAKQVAATGLSKMKNAVAEALGES